MGHIYTSPVTIDRVENGFIVSRGDTDYVVQDDLSDEATYDEILGLVKILIREGGS